MHQTKLARVWLASIVLAAAFAPVTLADDRAKRDADNSAQLYAELTKIVPAGWQIANRLEITPAVSREPRLTFVIYSAARLPFEHIEIGAPVQSGEEPDEPAVMETVEIRLVTVPYHSPKERAAVAERNARSRKQRVDFERQHLRDVEYASKEPRPLPPWDYAMQDANQEQQELLRQYMFLWLRTESVSLPSHHYRTLAFQMESRPWGTIRDKQKMKQYQEILAALQQIVAPYDKPANGEFVGESTSQSLTR